MVEQIGVLALLLLLQLSDAFYRNHAVVGGGGCVDAGALGKMQGFGFSQPNSARDAQEQDVEREMRALIAQRVARGRPLPSPRAPVLPGSVSAAAADDSRRPEGSGLLGIPFLTGGLAHCNSRGA